MIYTHDFVEQLNTSPFYEQMMRYNQSKFSPTMIEEHGIFTVRDRCKELISVKKFTYENTPSIKGTVNIFVNNIDDATNRSYENNKLGVSFQQMPPTIDYCRKGMMMKCR